MFLSGWDGWVWALDAKTGVEIWRYKHAVPFDVSLCCGNVNRGVAVAKGKVFFVTANAHVLALDATTGKRVWDRTYGDVRAGESATVAPLVVKNMVIVGQLRRRVRRARPPRRVRHRHRRAPVALLHGPEARRARLRDLARRRRGVGAGRRELLGHRHLRPGDEPAVRGHRQPGARLRRRGPRGRQPLHRQHHRRRRRQPARSAGTTSAPRTTCGTTTASPSASCSSRTGASCSGTSTRTATSSSLDRTNGELVAITPFVDRIDWGDDHPGRQGDRRASTPRRRGNRSTSTRVRPAPRNGRTRPTARRPSCSTSRCRTSGPRPPGGAGSSRRASRTGARAFRWTSRTWRGPSARSTPTVRRSGAGATSFRCARRCSPRAATWCSPVSPPGSSTRSTPAPGSCCGSSSAEAATTAARRPTRVDGRQYIAVPVGWGGWAEGFLPGMLGAGHGSALIVFALPD